MSDAIKQDVLIMTGNLSLDAALALVVSQQNEIEALKDKYERLKATHIETAKESSLREADNQDLRAENEKLRAELRDADVMLLNQARTIRDYQDAAAALKETGK